MSTTILQGSFQPATSGVQTGQYIQHQPAIVLRAPLLPAVHAVDTEKRPLVAPTFCVPRPYGSLEISSISIWTSRFSVGSVLDRAFVRAALALEPNSARAWYT